MEDEISVTRSNEPSWKGNRSPSKRTNGLDHRLLCAMSTPTGVAGVWVRMHSIIAPTPQPIEHPPAHPVMKLARIFPE
ncbi:MAG: hypothetical protein U0610_08810 [bacterium]